MVGLEQEQLYLDIDYTITKKFKDNLAIAWLIVIFRQYLTRVKNLPVNLPQENLPPGYQVNSGSLVVGQSCSCASFGLPGAPPPPPCSETGTEDKLCFGSSNTRYAWAYTNVAGINGQKCVEKQNEDYTIGHLRTDTTEYQQQLDKKLDSLQVFLMKVRVQWMEKPFLLLGFTLKVQLIDSFPRLMLLIYTLFASILTHVVMTLIV